ncbi:MAG: YceI family protein [Saprospiraceae bacterium]|nr:YceI family protein [Saprospiraceae bacterium]
MKQISLFLFPALLLGISLFSCKETPAPKAKVQSGPVPDTIRVQPVSTEGAVTLTVTEGTVNWSAKKAIGNPHNGTINISGGELLVNQGQLLSGSVKMDMRTIAVTNLNDGGEKATLESHLKDKDFFDVNNHPEASFTVVEVLPSNLSSFNWVVRGNLTIKGNSHMVNVPVRMSTDGNTLEAESALFIINRTQWGINFRSGMLGTAKDKIVEDVVPLSLKIKAKKK